MIIRISIFGILVLTSALHSLGKAQSPSSQTKRVEKQLSETQSKNKPIFAFVATSYHKYGKSEEDLEFFYRINDKTQNLADKFSGVNLKEDGQEGGIATFSGVVFIIVQYEKEVYIVNMFFREKNVFSIYHAQKTSSGDYVIIGNYRESIVLPELYKRLEYLFPENWK